MIHPIYFSCRNDIKLLCISLQTLGRLAHPNVGMVHVFFDKANTPTGMEVRRISEAHVDVCIHSTEHQARGGSKMFRTEIEAYKKIADHFTEPGDWLMKCDCDTFWLKPTILDHVLESKASMVGHASINLDMIVWTQGGCYFLRAGKVGKLQLDAEGLEARMVRMFKYHDHTY